MTELHRIMEIDTCPMCGDEIWARENGFLGKQLEDISKDAVFEIACNDNGVDYSCGIFRITKRDPNSSVDDWTVEYIPTPCPIPHT